MFAAIRRAAISSIVLVILSAFLCRPISAQDAPLCASCWAVAVTPDGWGIGEAVAGTYQTGFSVENQGSLTDIYSIGCSSSGSVECVEVSHSTMQLAPFVEGVVFVTYTVAVGGGTLYLTATGNASDQGSVTVTLNGPPTVTLVAPVLTSGSRSVVRSHQPLIRATYMPNAALIDTTKTRLVWQHGGAVDTVTPLARANRGLLEWEVDSAHALSVGDSGLATVKVCATDSQCSTVTRWVVLPNDGKPVLGFATPLESHGRQFAAPFGPGLSVAGADVQSAIGIPAYVSMGSARGAGLVYSTRQSYPRALVPIDLELTWPAGTPDQIKVLLFDGATKLDSLVVGTPTCATGSARRCRLVLQGDFGAASFSTPTRKWLTVEARVTSGGTTHSATDSVEVVLVDRRSTPYGSGWWPSGVLKLVAAGSDRILIGPTGTAMVYRGNGDSMYLAPPGDFSTLVKVSGGRELRARGTLAKLVFDNLGRLSAIVDANGNTASITYSGSSDQVTAFNDPVGKSITLAYDGNGKLSTFTDPASRQSRVTIDGGTNQLTYDSISSPATRPFTTRFFYQTYPGTHTVVLTKVLGVIADTTIVTYDSTFKRRPTQVRFPGVVDETGAAVNPTIGYTAVERQGFGSLRSLDSTYLQITDPRGNWTRSLVNRWGQPLKTWDAMSLLSRSAYSPEGLPLWSEGKNGDSSRVYSSYDGFSRLARTYVIRPGGSVLRLDSLVYDANHRVIKRIDARGKRDSVVYDAFGNVTLTISPHNDTTRLWYRADGLVDSVRAPGNSVSRRVVYDSIWKNVEQGLTELGTVLFKTTFDALGRDSLSDRKVRVNIKPGITWFGWERTELFYNAAGQIDSSQQRTSTFCTAPCDTPGSWGSAKHRVSLRFDRAGRDSVRVNETGGQTLYLYDRLGRLVSRRPWVDSMAVKDSLVYDLAGNLKKTITRRGDTIITNYDSRNRDTLTVIPGVGLLRRAFAGPLDQLTRLWYDSPVDPIGGVNGEVRWAYDQRGRLAAETTYTGAIARATSYTYDTFERVSTTTDQVGTWTTKYETDRGYADTLLTPMGDTVTYFFDWQSRANGPSVRGGGSRLSRAPSWGPSGVLEGLTNSVTISPNFYTPLAYARTDGSDDAPAPLKPRWYETHGLGGVTDTLVDTTATDAHGRIISWRGYRNGSAVAIETYTYADNTDLLTAGGDTNTYHAITRRLTARSTGAGTWSYSYDRAGNLVEATLGATTWTYTYDALNRLTAASRGGTLIARYAYDVLGRRIVKRVYSSASGGTVGYMRFAYRGSHVAFETDSVATTMGLRYTWGLAVDDLVAIRDASGNHYYAVQDPLHSVRGLIGRDSVWFASWRYAPYGAGVDSAGSAPVAVRYRWTGREYDSETGFYYFRARYYDPGVRRFVQEDPIGYAGGASLYAYAGGNPITRRDPSGLHWMYEVLVNVRDMYMWNNCWTEACDGDFGDVGRGDPFFEAWWDAFYNRGVSPGAEYEWTMYLEENGLRERLLSESERAALGSMCAHGACDQVRVLEPINATTQARGGRVLGDNTIYVNGLLTLNGVTNVPLLGHELTHLFQIDSRGEFSVIMAAHGEQLLGFAHLVTLGLLGRDPYAWSPGRAWEQYRIEQQGAIVAACLTSGHPLQVAACGLSPWH